MSTSQKSGGFAGTTFPRWQRAVFFSVGYFLCAWVGSRLSVPGALNVSFWLPAGWFIALLLRNPKRDWCWLALAALPASVLFELIHEPVPEPKLMAVFYLANVVRSFAGAWLVRTFVAEQPTLATLKEFFGVMLLGGIASALLGSLFGVTTLTILGRVDDFFNALIRWWASSAMSVLVFTPLLLSWESTPKKRPVALMGIKREAEITLFFLALSFNAWWLLVWGGGVNSPKVPLLLFCLWAGLRFGVRGAAATVFWMAVLMSFLTTHYLRGLTPEQIESKNYIVTLQIYLVVAALVALIPPILLTERDNTLRRLRESEERYRNLTHAAFEGIVISEHGRIVDVNQQCVEQFRCRREDLIGRELLDFVSPESRPAAAAIIRERRETIVEHRLLRPDGSQFDAEVQDKIMQIGERFVGMTALRDITQRKLAEQARRESDEKFAKAFRASPDGLAISELATGRYLEINDGYLRLFGYQRAEVIGRTSIELGLWKDLQDRERMVRELMTTGEARNLEVQLRTRAGDLRIVLLSAEKIEVAGTACLVSVVHDVTEQVQTESALRASEEGLRATIENTPNVAVQWYDGHGRVIFWNRASEKIFGWSSAEAVGKTLDELIFTPEQTANYQEALKKITATGQALGPLEFPFRHRDGSAGMVLSTVFKIPVPGAEPRFVCMDVDLTERKKVEAEREASVAREQKARIEYTLRLIASQESERKRIAAELHDSLGQNLLLIKNLAQMALREEYHVAVGERLASIDELAASCIAEARQISRALHPHQLDHLGLKRALEVMLESTSAATEMKFAWKIDEVEGIFSDEAAMNFYRIVQESLSNTLKHSRAKNVRVKLERDIHEIVVEIVDDGCGFDATASAANKNGMGLQNIGERVRMLGGAWRTESAPGQGTRLYVTVPIPAEAA